MAELNCRSIALLVFCFGFGGYLVVWDESSPSSPFIIQSYVDCID